jgi:excinuclease UvrABC helicase subunit UvrB
VGEAGPLSSEEVRAEVEELTKQMKAAAERLEFELAGEFGQIGN